MTSSSSAGICAVVPTHNRRRRLERALRSVEAQTRLPDRVMVIDDGSTDGSEAMVRERFPRVELLRQERRGVSAARNRAIRTSSEDWLAFLDSDDEWLPEKLERQERAVQAEPELRLCHTDEIWIRGGRRVNPKRKHAKRGGRIFRHCLPLCAISPSSAMIHRSLFDEVGLFDEELPACEDYDLWLRICCRVPVLYLDEALVVKHGGRPDQLSRRVRGLDRYRIRALEKLLESGAVTGEDRRLALEALLEKIDIYRDGAMKRGKSAEAASYGRKRLRWQRELAGVQR